ncbi:LuxR C-terminal-related transcriptional regulator [Vibrio alfacsensis]|uniref:LuxR C-terminal-related transcriptional regulator n=1 Tax=Vibrio alfacsensis TaxID=1074311 RepID=UPI004068AC4C
MDHKSTGNIILVTEDSLQSSLLKDVLETKLSINVILITPEKLSNPPILPDNLSTIIFDYSVLNDDVFSRYMSFKASSFKDTIEVLINCDKAISTEELFVWHTLAGIFYISDDIDVLQVGIGRILQGDMWFSREFSQQYIAHLRRYSRPVHKNAPAVLTKREQQIMNFLSMGASNQQIAEQLFVSENTVKTHLHNIFKKIDVKNRVQALIWVKENISDLSIAT